MLIKLCARNDATLDGFVNGVDGILNIIYKKIQNHSYGYILKTFKLETTRLEISHLYKKFPKLNKSWTPIEFNTLFN